MRAFVIADSSKRKAKPIGMLFWEPDPTSEQGKFSIELSSACTAIELPLSLEFCAYRKGRKATHKQSEDWVKSRIVPENRQNIAAVLAANGLSTYSEIELLARHQGRSSDDDYLVYEVDLPSRKASQTVDDLLARYARIRRGSQVCYALVDLSQNGPRPRQDSAPNKGRNQARQQAPKQGSNQASASTPKQAPRQASGNLEQPPRADGTDASAAARVGAQIRQLRLEAGLTQKQLAASAGITQTVLSRVESGSGNPTLSLLEEISAALDTILEISLPAPSNPRQR